MSRIFLIFLREVAKATVNGQNVAVKTYSLQKNEADFHVFLRLRHESVILHKLSHPSMPTTSSFHFFNTLNYIYSDIVKLYGVCFDTPALLMEVIEGENLKQKLSRLKFHEFIWKHRIDLALQLASAILYPLSTEHFAVITFWYQHHVWQVARVIFRPIPRPTWRTLWEVRQTLRVVKVPPLFLQDMHITTCTFIP